MSRVLCLVPQVSAINLVPTLLPDFSNLPPDIGRAALSLNSCLPTRQYT